MRFLLLVGLAMGCVETSTFECSFGVTCGADALCDDAHSLCITQAQIDTCNGLGEGTICTIDLPDDGACDGGVCIPTRCGDGFLLGGEVCDGDKIGSINNCQQVGYYYDAPLSCKPGCSLDVSACTGVCGDNIVDADFELCDGAEPQATCVDFGYGAGVLGCSTNCGPGFAGCIPFGWQRYEVPEIVRDLHGSSATNVWAVGDNNMVQRFDGATWSPVNVSCLTPMQQVTSVFVLGPDDAFLITAPGVVRITASGCTSYTINAVGGTNQADVPHIWASSLSDAYVAGADGLFHFNGTAWTNVTTAPMVAIWGTAPNDVWAAAQYDVRHFDGAAWSTPVAIAGFDEIFGAWGDASGVYIAGTGPNGAIVKYNSGSGWTDVLENVPVVSAQSLAAFGATVGGRTYIGGVDLSGGTFKPFSVSNGGHGWMNYDAPYGSGRPFVGSDGSIVAGLIGTTSVVRFAGASLIETTTPPEGAYAIAARSEGEAYAVTPRFFAAGDVWAWDGLRWTAEQTANSYDVLVANDQVFSIIAGQVRRRTGPATWTSVAAMGGTTLAGTSASDLWTGSGTTIYHWNGAVSFTTMSFSVYDIWSASATIAYAVGSGGKIARWASNAWTEMTSPATGTVTRVWGFGPSDVYAVGDRLYHYDGTSWTAVSVQPPVGRVTDLWGTALDDLFVCATEGLFHFDGQRWTVVDRGTENEVKSLSGIGDVVFIGAQDKLNQLFRTRPW